MPHDTATSQRSRGKTSSAWINAHTDQVIILGSLIIGLWLIANSIYLIVM